jgi:hypothetical protein
MCTSTEAYNGRQVELKQKTMEGKGLLADAVRMLVAWQRSLTEEWSSKSSGAALVHVLVHAGLYLGIDSSRLLL